MPGPHLGRLLPWLPLLALSTAQTPLSCHPPTPLGGASAPSTGTLRASLLFVDFPDFPSSNSSSSPSDIYALMSPAPALYTNMSYGQLQLELAPHLDRWYRMPRASSEYNFTRGLTSETHRTYIEDALAAAGTDVDFDGTHVLYVLPPRGATEISFSPTAMFGVVAGDGTEIGNTCTFGQDMYDYWGFKTVNHETGHTMGLPDLYPYSGGTTVQWVGGFDIMGLISGQSPDYFAWLKWGLGWIGEDKVDCVVDAGKTTHTISPVEVGEGAKKLVAVPINSTAAVMAEVRSNRGIDEAACGTGVLIYVVNEEFASGYGPIRVVDSSPASLGCLPDNGGELNDAPFKLGMTYTSEFGISIAVTAQQGDDYVIEVERA